MESNFTNEEILELRKKARENKEMLRQNLIVIDNRLKAFFAEEDLEWRVQSCGFNGEAPWAMVLCYIQARAIQNRLDEVMGFENWKDEYRVEGTNIICRLSLKINGEWVAKENGASETDIEAFKGGISGAFKRVASSGFGIGRYLYDLDSNFAVCSLEKQKGWEKTKTKEGKYIYWEIPKMPAKFLQEKPPVDYFQKAKDDMHATLTEFEFDNKWIAIKKAKKLFSEKEFAELEALSLKLKTKFVKGNNV